MNKTVWIKIVLVALLISYVLSGIIPTIILLSDPLSLLDYPYLLKISQNRNYLAVALVVALIIYFFKKKYTAAILGAIAFYGFSYGSWIITVLFGSTALAEILPSKPNEINTLYLILSLTYAGCIFFSKARENRWLVLHAVIYSITTILSGNIADLMNFELALLFYFITVLSTLLYLPLIINSNSKSETKSNDDLVDNFDEE